MSSPVSEGTVLAGKYRVDRVLGEGGMGVVVAATDLQLERKVAIKFLLPEYSQHHEAAQRFLREARAAVKIQSEHVARVIDVGTMDSGAPYMVMEYLHGRDLAAVLDERLTLPVEEAVAYVLEACDAIAEAHSVGIVHRDLKPANLFLTEQPDGSHRIKVLDFGISKAIVTTATGIDPSLTRTSSLMGSPLYMSPEQMKSAKNVDPRTDVWALGVILYELLTGDAPFVAETIPELSAKVLLDEPVSIRSTRPDVPEELEAAIFHALAKDPKARHATVADLAAALSAFGPERTRSNVARAARVLKISTISSPTSAVVPPVPSTKAAYAMTAAAWTDSGGTGPKGETTNPGAAPKGRKIGAVLAAVAVVGVIAFVVLAGHGNHAPPEAAAGAVAPAVAAPPPVAEINVAPAKPADIAPASAPAASVVTVAPALPSATAAAPVVAAVETPSAAVPSKGPPRAVAGHAKPATKPKPEPAPAAAPAAPDPFSGFGNRK